MQRILAFVAVTLSCSIVSSRALAEGTADLNIYQGLFASTELYADIDDGASEEICFTGVGSMEVIDAARTNLGSVASGSCVHATPGVDGEYELILSDDQLDYETTSGGAIIVNDTYEWDIAVRDARSHAVIDGRVFSHAWQFGTPGFAETYATNGSFYARVPGGTPGEDAVVELRLRGLSGYVYTVLANRTGVEGDNAGRSVPQSDAVVYSEFPIYLNPPDLSTYSTIVPAVTGFEFDGGPAGCTSVAPGSTTGTFSYVSNVEGSVHLVCDLDGNGEFYDPEDLLIVRTADVGENTIEWSGLDNNGDPVPEGDYECRIRLNVGEFHYVGLDIETSYPGLRMFQVNDAGLRTPLLMRWDDTLVQAGDIAMPNGDTSPALPPTGGLDSQHPSLDAAPHGDETPGNARAWGAFASSAPRGKGDEACLDTYTWLATTLSARVTVSVVDGSDDRDGDGLGDALEECILGTDPDDVDTDHDNIGDFEETDGGSLIDTDGDGTLDALDDDSDDDGIDDIDEAGDTDLDTPAVDTDDDTVPDYRDPDVVADADGDGDPDSTDCDPDDPDIHRGADEVCNGVDDDCDGDVDEGFPDEDDNGIADCLEVDTDGDGLPDVVEIEFGTDPEDTDSDDDGVRDGDEGNGLPGGSLWNEDTDGDGLINALDPDSDDDGIFDGTELGRTQPDEGTDVSAGYFVPDADPTTTTDPTDPDTDRGGVPDGEEDLNHNGAIDPGERDPLDPADDVLGGFAGGGCGCRAAPRPGAEGAGVLALIAGLGIAILRRSR